ncbi:MAG: hypothetical protein M1821_007961 [Bathelium mastoideum]|nr:MAG: hypothetical protein M1821_007961 [Bathelium mastoideum]
MPNTNQLMEHVQRHVHAVNPFQSRPALSRRLLLTYRIIIPLSLIISIVPTTYYTFARPKQGLYTRLSIWGQNREHPSPFALHPLLTCLYWLLLFLLQAGYLTTFYARDANTRTRAANRASYFVLHNVFVMAFVHLWIRGVLWLAQTVLIADFVNLATAYIRFPPQQLLSSSSSSYSHLDDTDDDDVADGSPHFYPFPNHNGNHTSNNHHHHSSSSSSAPPSRSARTRARLLIHAASLAGPLAWSFVALFWCGAALLHADPDGGGPLFAHIALWLWFMAGAAALAAQRDWVLGLALSGLSAALGVQQVLLRKHAGQQEHEKERVLPLQAPFAFVVMGLLFVASVVVAGYDIAAGAKTEANGHLVGARGETREEAGETAPLLRDSRNEA